MNTETLICTHAGFAHDFEFREPDHAVGDKGGKTCRACGLSLPLTDEDLEDEYEGAR